MNYAYVKVFIMGSPVNLEVGDKITIHFKEDDSRGGYTGTFKGVMGEFLHIITSVNGTDIGVNVKDIYRLETHF